MDVYELVAARADGRGPGLKPSTGECRGFTNIGRLTSDGPPDPAWPTCMHGMMTGRRSISSRLGGYSVPQFARMLQRPAGRPVLDKTGREGLFDFLFDVTLVVDAASDIRPLDTALRESFGLTLQSARRAVDVLVIDSVSQPTQN
jgi:uncharacterized protein (TIGR03435 family)